MATNMPVKKMLCKQEKVFPDSKRSRNSRSLYFQAGIAAIVAWLGYAVLRNWIIMVISLLAVMVMLLGLIFPSWSRKIENVRRFLGRGAGLVLGWLLLAPIYYSFFSLGRGIFLLLGQDSLQRQWRQDQGSYWQAHESSPSLEQYKSQF